MRVFLGCSRLWPIMYRLLLVYLVETTSIVFIQFLVLVRVCTNAFGPENLRSNGTHSHIKSKTPEGYSVFTAETQLLHRSDEREKPFVSMYIHIMCSIIYTGADRFSLALLVIYFRRWPRHHRGDSDGCLPPKKTQPPRISDGDHSTGWVRVHN